MKNTERNTQLCNSYSGDYFYIALIYLIAWGLMVFNNGIYWDDWMLINVPIEAIRHQQIGTGYIFSAYFMSFVLSKIQSAAYLRCYLIIIHLGIGFFLFEILKSIRGIGRIDRFFITCIFVVLPINFARLSVSMLLIFNTYLFIFYLAFWILSKYFINRSVIYRVMSILLFLLSFSTPSFLVFYGIVLAYITYKADQKLSWLGCLKTAGRYADFLFAPIIFWILRSLYSMPFGVFEDYNKLNINGFLASPIRLWNDARYLINELLSILYSTFSIHLIELVIVGIVFTYFLNKRFNSELISTDSAENGRFLLLGIGCLFLAMFPYSVVEKHPYFDDWNSRHQILTGLGISLGIYYTIKLVVNYLRLDRRTVIVVCSIIIVTSMWKDILVQVEYYKDSLKQMAMMSHIEKSDIVKNNTSFLFVDNTEYLNALNREYRFTEFGGMMKKIYKDTKRFGSIHSDDWKKSEKWIPVVQTNISQFVPKPPEYRILINEGSIDLRSTNKTMKLLYLYWFDKERFNKVISDLIDIQYERL